MWKTTEFGVGRLNSFITNDYDEIRVHIPIPHKCKFPALLSLKYEAVLSVIRKEKK